MRINMHATPAQQRLGITLLRGIIGVVFLAHGLQKIAVTGSTATVTVTNAQRQPDGVLSRMFRANA